MAEALVVPLANKLSCLLVQKLFQEASLVRSFRDDFEFICDELDRIKCLLHDARKKSNYSDSSSIANFVRKLQNFLDDAVYIVEECEPQKINNPIFRYRMGRKIRTLKERIFKIHRSARYLKYAANLNLMNTSAQTGNAYSEDARKEKISVDLRSIHDNVGMQEDIDKITPWILEEDGGVIAIVGIGGLGKTLLVRNVFNNLKMQGCFDYLIWLEVSEKLAVNQLLLEMGRQIKLPSDEMKHAKGNNSALTDIIRISLEEKRVLFVLDDVWDTDALQQIGLPLHNTNKIVVTTRSRRVSDTMRALHTHSMEYLTEDNSWKLFCSHAFADCADRIPPPELDSIARQIEKKCYRLPLAVKTTAAYMANVRKLPNEWESELQSLNGQAHMNDNFRSILRSSYQALPDHLKPCFLYCSVFPQSIQIDCEYLVHAWIAEGFVCADQEVGGDTYHLGRSYLNELIDRCLIEVSQVAGDGRAKYCKIHDLLLDFAVFESQAVTPCLLNAGKKETVFPVEQCRDARRISLIKNDISTIKGNIQSPKLRTLLLWNNINLQSMPARFFNKLRYLCVLDLSESSIKSLPSSIGNLNHLKLLNLSRTKIEKLPRFLSGLTSLQILDLSWCEHLQKLHSGVGKHNLLLYLNLKGCEKLELFPFEISKLVFLRTLKGVVFKTDRKLKAAKATSFQWTDLKCLIHLQCLSVTFTISHAPSESESESPGINLNEGTFGGLTEMRRLFLENKNTNNSDGHDNSCLLHLPNDMGLMHRLEIVHLRNCALPKWISRLQNLMVLVLEGDNSASVDYRGIYIIPNLAELRLSHNKTCIQLPEEFGNPRAFPKLEKLTIEDFVGLENFPPLEEGAMSMLKYLTVKNCNALKDIPEEGSLDKLASLTEVDVQGCQHWKEGIRKGGHNWQILKGRKIKIKVT